MTFKKISFAILAVALLAVSVPTLANNQWQSNKPSIVENLALPNVTPGTLVKNEPTTVSFVDVTDRSDYRTVFLQAEFTNRKGKVRWRNIGVVRSRWQNSGEFWFLNDTVTTYAATKHWWYSAFDIPWNHKRLSLRSDSPLNLRLYARAKQRRNTAYVSPVFSLELLDIDLPPDPGAVGKETVDGIDMDNDGLRDDVQRYITIEYADDVNLRNALGQLARVQLTAISPTFNQDSELSQEQIEQVLWNVDLGLSCLFGLVNSGEASAISEDLEQQILNTTDRVVSSYNFDVAVGSISTYGVPPNDRLSHCMFDVVEGEQP